MRFHAVCADMLTLRAICNIALLKVVGAADRLACTIPCVSFKASVSSPVRKATHLHWFALAFAFLLAFLLLAILKQGGIILSGMFSCSAEGLLLKWKKQQGNGGLGKDFSNVFV